jgi:hypothetical protein
MSKRATLPQSEPVSSAELFGQLYLIVKKNRWKRTSKNAAHPGWPRPC